MFPFIVSAFPFPIILDFPLCTFKGKTAIRASSLYWAGNNHDTLLGSVWIEIDVYEIVVRIIMNRMVVLSLMFVTNTVA